MIELTFAILSILGGVFLVWLGWFAMRAVRSERRADSGRWRGRRESHRMNSSGRTGANYVGGEGYTPGAYVGSVGFWSW